MSSSLFDLTGKIGVVTGAARGLGKAVAIGLAAHGADVALVDLDAARCDATRDEIATLGRRALAYGCNVADEIAVRQTVGQIGAISAASISWSTLPASPPGFPRPKLTRPRSAGLPK